MFRRHAEWAKVANAVIEAQRDMLDEKIPADESPVV
jgi:hypothetical protein